MGISDLLTIALNAYACAATIVLLCEKVLMTLCII